ncbi:MAG: hypothetical protein QM779_11820 [Propionicimonas sp.]|uniref:DUF6907 domain-containing protein n=1 Tax=Propionicimonas sp. TaxID=1955623 RepID=UPI003D13D555
MATATEHRGPVTEVCPATHHAPNPSEPVHCPDWCTQVHDDRLWLTCCDVVVHTLPLEIHAFDADQRRAVVISLTAGEAVEGIQPAGLSIEATSDLYELTPDQVDEYAATLRRAAQRARAILTER